MAQKQKEKEEEKESESEYPPENDGEKQRKTKKKVPLRIKKPEKSIELKYEAEASSKKQADIEKKDPEGRTITGIRPGESVEFSADVGGKEYGTIEKAGDSTRNITATGLEYSKKFRPRAGEKQVEDLKQEEPSDRSQTIPPKYVTEFDAEVQAKESGELEEKEETEEGEMQSVKSGGLEGRELEEDTLEEPELELDMEEKSLGVPRDEPYIIFLRGDDISYELWSRLLLEEIEARGYKGTSNELDLDRIKEKGEKKPNVKDLDWIQRFIRKNRLLQVRDFSAEDLEEILEDDSLNSFFKMFLGRGDGLSVMLCKVNENVYLDDRIAEGKIIRDELWQKLKQMERKGEQIIFYSMSLLGAEKDERRESLASLLDVPSGRDFPITQLVGDGEVDEIESEWTNILDRRLFEYTMITSSLSKELGEDIHYFGDTDNESLQHIAMKMLVYKVLLTERNLKATPKYSEKLNEEVEGDEKEIEIEYPGERKIGDLYVPEEGLWIEVETGRLIGEVKETPEEYIYRKMINLQKEGEKISNLWIVFPLRKMFTWGEIH